jgi:hypothetical protein
MSKLILNKLLPTLMAGLLLPGCTGINRNISNLFFPPYPNSDQRQGESTIAFLDEQDCTKKLTPAAGPAAAVAAELLVKAVEKFLQDEAKRYTASYSAPAVGGFFTCDGSDINLKSITLHRRTTRYNTDQTPAMELVLGVRPQPDNMAFQIVPKKIALRQSKAKVAAIDITRPFGFDILAPWTIFQTWSETGGFKGFSPLRPAKVDMRVEVKLIGVWIDKDQKGRADEIAARTIDIPGVEIGQCIDFTKPEHDHIGDIVIDDNCDADKDLEKSAQNYLAQGKPELFTRVPRAYRFTDANDSNPKLKGSYGNYIVTVLVTEVDNFGERVMDIANTVKENEGTLIKSLQSLGE